MNCPCSRICRLSMQRRADGPFPECSPKEHYFFVVRDQYAKSADGGAEWDGEFIPGRHDTLASALEVVANAAGGRHVIEEVPRFTAFPKWSGHPEDARVALAESFSDAGMLATVSG